MHTASSSETDQTRPPISETRIELEEETSAFKLMKKVKDSRKATGSLFHKPPTDKTSKSPSERKT